MVGIAKCATRALCGVLALTGAAAVLSACGSTSTKTDSVEKASSTLPTALYQTFETAVQRSVGAEGDAPTQAFAVKTAECMRSKGFVYYESPVASGGSTHFVSAYQHPYSSLAKREIIGYGLYNYYVANENQSHQHPELKYIRSLGPAKRQKYWNALQGPPGHVGHTFNIVGFGREDLEVGGCQGLAVREVYGSAVAGWYVTSLVMIPVNEIHTLEREPSFQRSQQSWSACMTKDGYTFSSPSMAISSLESQYAEDGPTPALQEKGIAIAVADYHCATTTGYKSVYDAALCDSVTTLSPQGKIALAAASRDLEAALIRAQRILG